MRYEYHLERKRFADRRSLAEPATDLLLITSLVLSFLIHGLFLLGSTKVRVAVVGRIEEQISRMFDVEFRDLSQPAATTRPPPGEILKEREQALREDLQKAERVPAPDIDRQLEEIVAEAGEPVDVELLPQEVPQGLAAGGAIGPPAVITSPAGVRPIGRGVDSSLRGAVSEQLTIERPALASSGDYRQKRIVETLPGDLSDTTREPPSVAVTAPTLDASAPDASLQPGRLEIAMPKPDFQQRPLDLADVPPGVLTAEERFKETIANKFVRLDDVLGLDILTYRKKPGEGYFLLRIRPKESSERLRSLPKDVILVLDASASMGTRTLGVLKETIKQYLSLLNQKVDRFSVVGFKNRPEMFSDKLEPVSPMVVSSARQFIDTLNASGKTDIYTSLEPLMALGTERARPLQIFLYSDGRPTMGVKDSRAIINHLSALRGPSTSVFAVGAGDSVNRYLLDFLAFRNRGSVCFVESRGNVQNEALAFARSLRNPVLLRVTTDFGVVNRSEVYPQELPDLYQDTELEIWGRFSDEKQLTVRLVGEAYDEQKEMIARLDIPKQDRGGPEVAKGWALHKIYHLISLIVQHGENPEILGEVNRLSGEYGIVTPYHEQFQK
jgi:hypothetical protein